MKTPIKHLLLMLSLLAGINQVQAQGTQFTYQGRLNVGGNPANGSYDFMGKLYDVNSNQVSITLTNTAVPVSNGLFTTTLDFGYAFAGDPRWLNLWVRTNGGGAFTALTPGQKLTATPYAITAEKVTGLISDSQITGPILRTTFNGAYTGQLLFTPAGVAPFAVGSTSKVVDLNADLLDGLDSSAFWKLAGNAGTTPGTHFLGTTDNQALELKVNGIRALRVEPATDVSGFIFPNVIGGVFNSVAAGRSGSTIGGGRENTLASTHTVVSGGWRNQILADSEDSAIVGGQGNNIQANAGFSTIGAGAINQVGPGAYRSTVGGGYYNRILSDSPMGTIAGGQYNLISSNSPHATIGGGTNNSIGEYSSSATIAGGGLNNLSYSAEGGTISGGIANQIGSYTWQSAIGGGYGNLINYAAYNAVIGGGYVNQIYDSADYAVIGGGYANEVRGSRGVVPGGSYNKANGANSFAAGYAARALHAGCFVWSDPTGNFFFPPGVSSTGDNQFVIRATGGVQFDPATSLFCGTQTRQMLNLWSTNYGIGVQGYTMYFRTDGVDPVNGFSWYKGGVHNDDYANAGGGIELMHLIDGGLYVHGTFNNTSDRNAKENFASVVPADVLGKVIALPITRWNYKHDPATPHLGPVAQDFHAAFGVGPDDKHIATVDESGVALAAIQGLNQKVDSENATLRAENAELKQRLEKLEQLMNHNNGGVR